MVGILFKSKVRVPGERRERTRTHGNAGNARLQLERVCVLNGIRADESNLDY